MAENMKFPDDTFLTRCTTCQRATHGKECARVEPDRLGEEGGRKWKLVREEAAP